MLIKTRGIVFRSRKYSESSLIVEIFTEAKGVRSYIISGVRKKNARVSASLLQLMSLIEMVAYHRDDKTLTRIKEIKAAYVYQHLPFDFKRRAVGIFMTEIAAKTITESEENKPLFNFLYESFTHLDTTTHPVSNLHLHFMLHLSTFLGFMPGGEVTKETPIFDMQEGNFVQQSTHHRYTMSPQSSYFMSQLLEVTRTEAHSVKMNYKQRRQLLLALIDFYQLHIENLKEIHAHLILEEVLRDEVNE